MGGGPEGTERPTDCTFHLCLLLETVTEVPPQGHGPPAAPPAVTGD